MTCQTSPIFPYFYGMEVPMFLMIVLSLMAACDRGSCDGTECVDDTDDPCNGCTDGDIGTLTVTATKLGVPEACQVNVAGPEVTSWNTADAASAELPVGTYEVTLGLPNRTTTDAAKLPVHEDGNGEMWITPKVEATLAKDAEIALARVLTRYIDAEYRCAYHAYVFKPDGSEFDAGINVVHDADNNKKFRVRTETTGGVHSLVHTADWGIDDKIPKIVGDKLLPELEDGATILSSAIHPDDIRFVWNDPSDGRFDIRCCPAATCAEAPSGF